MASQEKKTTGGKRAASTAKKKTTTKKKAATGKSSAKNKSERRPVRREVTGVVLLLVALCVLVSFFSKDGWLTDALPRLLRGLFGIGYFVTVPALAVAAWILLTHRGRPVLLRSTSALLQPYLFGIICHLLFCRQNFTSMDGLIPRLWTAGDALQCGGVLSGATAQMLMVVLGRPLSVIVLLCLIVVLIMVAFELSLMKLLQMWRERERLEYDEEDYEEYEPIVKTAAPTKTPAAKRAQIDIPLDDPTKPADNGEGFFKPRAKNRLTPAELLEQEAGSEQPKQQEIKEEPVQMPAAEIMSEPIMEPTEEPQEELAPVEEKRRSKKPTAAEVE